MKATRAAAPMVALKILLSLPVAYALVYPLRHPEVGGGVLGELQAVGPVGGAAVVLVFLGLVVAYAYDLRRTLQLVGPHCRPAAPNSVWWMLAIPYNFIEDFAIVRNVSVGLRWRAAEGARIPGEPRFGLAYGYGWCIAQLLSLLPNLLGSLAGGVALLLWVLHWRVIRAANRALVKSG